MAPLPRELDAHIHLVEEAYSRRTRGGIEAPLIVSREQIGEIMDVLADSLDAFADRFGLPRGNR